MTNWLTDVWMSMAPVLLGAAMVFLAYTYLGYPILMAWLARRNLGYGPARVPAAAVPDSRLPTMTVIIAAHNAGEYIERKLDSCLAMDYPADKLTVLVFSDGSTDATLSKVELYAARFANVRLMHDTRRRGKAACINEAIATCTSEILFLTDARQMIDSAAARFLVSHFADPSVGAVSGALEIARSRTHGVVDSAGAYWRMEKKLRAAEAKVHSTVGVTGAIYALRLEAFRPIPEETILDDLLIPMTAVMNGYRVLFDKRALAFDVASDSEAMERARKIRTMAGNFQILMLRPSLASLVHNPVWCQFLSHKVFRVIAPLALGVLLMTTMLLAPTGKFWAVMLAGQLFVYAVTMLPEGHGGVWESRPLRVLKQLRGFVRLQWYAVLGFIWFLRNRQPQLWPTTQHNVPTRLDSTRPASQTSVKYDG